MKKLLVPIDFSDTSINALKYAVQLAERLDLPMTVLHVTRLKIRANFSAVSEINRMEQELIATAKARLSEVVEQHLSETSVK